MGVTQHRGKPAGQRGVDQHCVEIGRDLRTGDRMPFVGDAVVEIGERLFIGERRDLGHELSEEIERPVRLLNEGVEMIAIVEAALLALALDQHLFGAADIFGRRQIDEGQHIGALEQRARLLKGRTPFLIHEPRNRVGKIRVRIIASGMAFSFEEQRPVRAETAQHIVDPRAGGDQFGLRRAFEVGTAEARRTLEAAILVEDDAGRHEAGPGQIVRQQCRTLAVFGQVQHGIRLNIRDVPCGGCGEPAPP